MNMINIVENQRKYFLDGNTKSIENRIKTLVSLKKAIKTREKDILKALNKDLRKSDFEGYITEIGLVYEEINIAIKRIKKWSKRERVKSSLLYFPSKNYIYKDPYGVVLIIGPFNYPFQLIMSPLVGAIAGGNCAVIKPSEYSINTSLIIEEIINSTFCKEYITVVNPLGGKEVVSSLLDMKFDYIFFTGSIKVGKIVMEKASKNLTPVTLELGGKSPCIVDKDANLKMAAKRIVWGKYLNAGQTCVAPDYLYVHKSIREKFLKMLVDEIKLQFTEDHKESTDFCRIISDREVDRLSGYINEGTIYYGGDIDKINKYISPTILINIREGSKILEEEIFGPILPVYEFEEINEVIEYVNNNEKPLALYYFSESSKRVEHILESTSSGGVTINDTVIHCSESNIPFGGVGSSGMGQYHGKASFDVFTHKKSVVKRGTFIELPIRFAPYKDKINLLRKILK